MNNMENRCNIITSVSIIFPKKSEKELRTVNIQKRSLEATNDDVTSRNISSVKKLNKINFLPFFKTRNCVIKYLEDGKPPIFFLTSEGGRKEKVILKRILEEVKIPNLTVTDVTDINLNDYGCTMSDDDLNLICGDCDCNCDYEYFDDYGIEDFYALSTERNATLRCDPAQIIIGKDVWLRDTSVHLDDLSLYYLSRKTKAVVEEKKLSLVKNQLNGNLSSILISKVLKSHEVKRKCQKLNEF